jgi:ribosome maturation protein SDO1
MVDVVAKIKSYGKSFEILVDSDKALAFKKGQGDIRAVVKTTAVFHDIKKGFRASESDLKQAFGTTEILKIAERIIKEGEIQLPAEYRAKMREAKFRQVVDFLSTNCIDPRTAKPHPAARIEAALKQAGVKIDENKSVDEQIWAILRTVQKILPIKIETKRLALKIPAIYAGKVYGIVKEFMLKEEWLADGSLSCTVELPAASQSTFFDKLNNITHGTALTQELKE